MGMDGNGEGAQRTVEVQHGESPRFQFLPVAWMDCRKLSEKCVLNDQSNTLLPARAMRPQRSNAVRQLDRRRITPGGVCFLDPHEFMLGQGAT